VRESPAAEIMELLRGRGALLSYSDPHVPEFPPMREHDFDLKSVALDAHALAAADCVLLVTDHDAFDYETIARHAKLLVDTRGRYPRPAPNLVKA
jgi:UDP-N-acetyl-D-glucosamine dehydrogenase